MQHSTDITAITLRDLPPKVARKIREKARRDGTSLNKTVIHMLEEGLGLRNQKAPESTYDDLKMLSGKWSKKEAAEFDRTLHDSRSIDEDMWK